jgi:hypothetical protein
MFCSKTKLSKSLIIELMKECSVRGEAQSIMGLTIFSVANRFPRQLFTHFIAVEENG